MLKELKIEVCKPIALLINNKSTIDLAKNPVVHGRRKYIEARFYFNRKQVNKEMLKVIHCPTAEQLANLFTKAVKIDRFFKLRKRDWNGELEVS